MRNGDPKLNACPLPRPCLHVCMKACIKYDEMRHRKEGEKWDTRKVIRCRKMRVAEEAKPYCNHDLRRHNECKSLCRITD